GDDDVVAFTHAEVDRLGVDRLDGESVRVGDGENVVSDRESEDGVGGGVDQTEAHSLAGLRLEDLRRVRNPAVDEEVRVGHIAGVAPGLIAHRHLAMIHSAGTTFAHRHVAVVHATVVRGYGAGQSG